MCTFKVIITFLQMCAMVEDRLTYIPKKKLSHNAYFAINIFTKFCLLCPQIEIKWENRKKEQTERNDFEILIPKIIKI